MRSSTRPTVFEAAIRVKSVYMKNIVIETQENEYGKQNYFFYINPVKDGLEWSS